MLVELLCKETFNEKIAILESQKVKKFNRVDIEHISIEDKFNRNWRE